jgi:CheY-like chemotaxis protein
MLLVEDSAMEAVLVEKAVQECDQIELIHIARDGEEAIAFLHRMSQHDNADRPDLILLDLHMPRKDGFEVLKEIKQNANLRSILVIFFTTSDREEDIAKSYADGASTFIMKPASFDELRNILKDLGRYWSNAKLPVAPGAYKTIEVLVAE